MGTYPNTKYEHDLKSKVLKVTQDTGWGLTKVTFYEPIAVLEHRKTCYCCSCGDREGSDPFCRNHGFAGTRACEEHEMHGDKFVPNYEGEGYTTEVMLTVQQERQQRNQEHHG